MTKYHKHPLTATEKLTNNQKKMKYKVQTVYSGFPYHHWIILLKIYLTNKENFQYISRYFAYSGFKRNCSQNTLVKCLGCLQNYKVTEILLALTFATHQPFSFQKTDPLQQEWTLYQSWKKKKNQDTYLYEGKKSEKKNESFAIKSSHKMVMWCILPRGKDHPEKNHNCTNFLQETASYLLFTVLSSADKLCFFLEKQNFIFES